MLKTQKSIQQVPIVDLFAGPGGLGEGFSSLEGSPFQIIVSAEMEDAAHSTLRLRAFYRLLRSKDTEQSLKSYYEFCNGESQFPYDESNREIWLEAGVEAQQLTLGDEEDNRKLDCRINSIKLGPDKPWVLIGGPPCQAYSVVGRARNRGEKDYRAEEDQRHFLYKQYLRIIQKYRPSVFVMENVKGILSASVGGQKIFHTILQDLSDPDAALGELVSTTGYRIYSLSCKTSFGRNDKPEDIDAHDFVVKAEEYGIPQARHRVILLGVREDVDAKGIRPGCLTKKPIQSVWDAIGRLPILRSKLSKQADSGELWAEVVRRHHRELAREASTLPKLKAVQRVLSWAAKEIETNLPTGSLRFHMPIRTADTTSTLEKWYRDDRLKVWLNHEARGHMSSDLRRYAYAASFAEAFTYSPKGHAEFALNGLRPNHENWETGKFSDRFRVQLEHRPATTITSHISKDGHYFIHYDPRQCRSLTVREAARLQTFPDNYFFQGNRTQQFHQVGNAVPPLLAHKIAEIVIALLNEVALPSALSMGQSISKLDEKIIAVPSLTEI